MQSNKKRKPSNASVAAQKEWAKMPKTLKTELRKQLPDSDNDRVPNGFDCRPLNKKKQESFSPADAKYADAHTLVYRDKYIGRGDNGYVSSVKNNKNLVVKLGHMGDTSTLREEEKFFKDNKLNKQPLFIPTKVVHVGKSKEYGLLRPAITPLIDSQDGVKNSREFTDSRLKTLKAKLTTLSMRGFVFEDGLQLGVDRAGRILQFDFGLMQRTTDLDYAFETNNREWTGLLRRLGKASKYGKLVKPAIKKTSNTPSKAPVKTKSKPSTKPSIKEVSKVKSSKKPVSKSSVKSHASCKTSGKHSKN